MNDKFVSERNLKFLLYEVFKAEELTLRAPYTDHDKESFDMTLDTALKLGRKVLQPYLREMDTNPPELRDGAVHVHPAVRGFMREFGDGGWISAGAPAEVDGQQLPTLITSACHFIFGAANYSASVYPLLTAGAARLVYTFAGPDLIEKYVPAMFAGRIQGTMALTEPHAGSSLADLTTAARPTDEGHYLITGTKIFISAGDHDAVDNVVHLLLARIQGAPPGVKGISLFLVPKLREGDDGKSVSNDVAVAGVYHKLGYRGAPITQLQFGENGDCRGYLVGREHQGLACMFQMMNEARIGVGLGATAIGSAAYYAALQYCRERPQGRKPGVKDPCAPQVPLIEHADVKRMLLFQRAIMEGSLSLALQCGKYEDVLRSGDGPARERAHLLLEALTPAAKSYPSEMCIHTVSAGLQCLGGYGYCDEFPLEQFYRDARIHPIHEGTTGIQALDLLGRKMTAAHGAAAHAFAEEVAACARDARIIPELDGYAQCLTDAVDLLGKVFHSLAEFAVKGETEVFCADAVLFLEMFGITAVAWQWLLQGIAAHEGLRAHPGETDVDFYRGKLLTMRYFFHYELPKTAALAKRLMETDGLTVHAADRDFRD